MWILIIHLRNCCGFAENKFTKNLKYNYLKLPRVKCSINLIKHHYAWALWSCQKSLMYLKRFLKYEENYIFFIILYKYLRLHGYHGNKKYIKYWKKLENEISYIVLLYYSTCFAKIQKSILHNFQKAHFVCYTAPLWMEYLKAKIQNSTSNILCY